MVLFFANVVFSRSAACTKAHKKCGLRGIFLLRWEIPCYQVLTNLTHYMNRNVPLGRNMQRLSQCWLDHHNIIIYSLKWIEKPMQAWPIYRSQKACTFIIFIYWFICNLKLSLCLSKLLLLVTRKSCKIHIQFIIGVLHSWYFLNVVMDQK